MGFMKLILLTAGGRAGSDFFHSLLDEHPEILQFPGYLRVNENLIKILTTINLYKQAKLFTKYYPEFFESKINKFERWNKLGEKKNKSFKINKKKFIQKFVFISKKKKANNNLNILKNFHLAYFLARKKSIKNLKIFFVHTHLLKWTKDFIKIFDVKNVEIIHTIRHPISAISAPLKSWLNFKNGKNFFSKDLFFQLNLVVNSIYDLTNLGNVYTIQLERLHTKNNLVMKNFCNKFNISYKQSLTKSTKNGLKWWADSVSKKYIYGFNKNFTIKIYKEYFFDRDLIFFQNLTEKIIKKYNYKFYFKKKNIFFNLLPMKCELIVWKNTFINLFSNGFRWKHLVSIPLFYFLRILLINKIYVNLNNKKLPIVI